MRNRDFIKAALYSNRVATLLRLLRWLIGLAILLKIFSLSQGIYWTEPQARAVWKCLLVAVPLHFAFVGASILQLNIFLRRFHPVPFLTTTTAFLTYQYAGLLLPGGVSMALLVPLLRYRGISLPVASGALIVPRLINAILLALVALLFVVGERDNQRVRMALELLLVTLCLPLLGLLPPFRRHLRTAVAAIAGKWMPYFDVMSQFVRRSRSALLGLVGLALLKNLIAFSFLWLFVVALGGRTPFLVIAGASAIATFAGLLSFIPASFGVYEASLVLFTRGHGDPLSVIFLASLLCRLTACSSSVLCYWAIRFAAHRKEAASPRTVPFPKSPQGRI